MQALGGLSLGKRRPGSPVPVCCQGPLASWHRRTVATKKPTSGTWERSLFGGARMAGGRSWLLTPESRHNPEEEKVSLGDRWGILAKWTK